MHKLPVKILSTKEISAELILKAAEEQVQIEQVPFIRIEFISKEKLLSNNDEILNQQSGDIILTSINAVEAMNESFGDKYNSSRFYCVGEKSAKKLRALYSNAAIITAENSAALAESIIAQGDAKEFIYFCGNRRRDELPAILKQNGIVIHEFELYRTINNPVVIEKDYDGFLFFSPSAVESFFSVNELSHSKKCFAIGETTANSLKPFHGGDVIVSPSADSETLIQTTIEYFKKN